MKLNARMVKKRKNPGNVEIHHAVSRSERPAAMTCPHEGMVGSPSWRNDSAASARMYPGMASVAAVMTVEETFGMRWRLTTHHRPAPAKSPDHCQPAELRIDFRGVRFLHWLPS